MRFLKQSTAFTFRIGPFLDDTDGKTAETGLSIGQADIQISKAGGAFAQTSASPTTTHDADGWYQCPLTATDTGTLGALTVQVAMSGALPVWEHFMVLPANIYDSLVGGSDYLQVDAIQIEGSDATDQVNAACDTAISDASLATAAALATVDGIVDDILVDTGTTIPGTITTLQGNVTDILTDTGTTIPGTITTMQGNVTDILADTNELQTDWANGGRLDLILDAAGSAGDPWSTELPGAYGAGTAGKIVGDNINAPIATIDTVVDAIKAKTDSLTFTVAGNVDVNVQTWKGSTAADMTGDAYARLGAPAGASVSADVAAVKSDSAAILTDTNELQTNQGNWATAVGFSTHSAADVKTAIEAAGSHLTLILEDTGTTIPGLISDLDTVVDRVEADTQDLQTQIGVAGAGLTAINLPDQTMNITGNITGNLSGSVGSVAGAVGSVTGNVGGTVARVTLVDTCTTNTDMLTAAAVNAEVDSALNTAIPATPTASSINDYVKKMKIELVNAKDINADGDSIPYDDAGSALTTVAAAYSLDSTTVKRKKLL